MLLEISDLAKSFGGRGIVFLKKLCLYAGDRVAVVGRNGAGKTTLLRMIAGEDTPDSGRIVIRGRVAIIPQLGKPGAEGYSTRFAAKLGIINSNAYSGGERTKACIAQAMAKEPDILLADEPTTNLDLGGIAQLETLLRSFGGALLLISHDRALLEAVCNKVLEAEQGTFTLYGCGYHEYAAQKALEIQTRQSRYEAYQTEHERLKQVVRRRRSSRRRFAKRPDGWATLKRGCIKWAGKSRSKNLTAPRKPRRAA